MNVAKIREYLNANPFIAIVLVAGVVAGVFLSMWEPASEPTVAIMTPPPAVQSPKPPASQPQLPQGYKSGEKVRNPFAAPPDYTAAVAKLGPEAAKLATANAAPPSTSSGQQKPSSRQISHPVLLGIGSIGQDRLAIIEYQGVSQPYRAGEKVGSYTVRSISDTTVSLAGPSGRLDLKMGGL